MTAGRLTFPKLGYFSATNIFLLIAAFALLAADLTVSALNPWAETPDARRIRFRLQLLHDCKASSFSS